MEWLSLVESVYRGAVHKTAQNTGQRIGFAPLTLIFRADKAEKKGDA